MRSLRLALIVATAFLLTGAADGPGRNFTANQTGAEVRSTVDTKTKGKFRIKFLEEETFSFKIIREFLKGGRFFSKFKKFKKKDPTDGDGNKDKRKPFALPLPSSVSNEEYQTALYSFLGSFRYRKLGYARDKKIRDTGPWLNGRYHGTHPAVRLYYSPEVIEWLENGRAGKIPDGAIIIKEMYDPPAARYEGPEKEPLPRQWATMVKDSGAETPDGWYWSFFDSNPTGAVPPVPQEIDSDEFPFQYPDSDFGLYCVRCHTSAASEHTFSDLANIEGYPGEPLEYDNDGTWVGDDDPGEDPHPNDQASSEHEDYELGDYLLGRAGKDNSFVNQEWLQTYGQFPYTSPEEVQTIPGVTTDRVVSNPDHLFMTSDQCLSCHAGQNPIHGPNFEANMFIPGAGGGAGIDISPFTEWRWSMMGLAGRDPIFYAQLETEIALLQSLPNPDITPEHLQNLCFRCHGVMGQRQFANDFPGKYFSLETARAHKRDDPFRKYGGLARDGVSCMVCHQIVSGGEIRLVDIQTGNFDIFPRDEGGNFQIMGPFDDPVKHAMVNSIAAKTFGDDGIKFSINCGSCHTVFLPVMDNYGRVVDEKYEQATLLEWALSDFGDVGSNTQQCQECHMAPDHPDLPGVALAFKVANIQDQDYPISFNEAPEEDRTIEVRENYRRHTLNGINVFALEMFRQFPDILGVRHSNFMSGVNNGIDQAIRTAAASARNESGIVEILSTHRAGDQLTARVRVTNLAGHRFPSGVGFRRLILELVIRDPGGAVIWGSGRTDKLGIVVDQNGVRLPSEFHEGNTYQPHYTTIDVGFPITAEDQVQLYEELLTDSEGNFTTSFLRRFNDVKDNRLLPRGLRKTFPSTVTQKMIDSLQPHGRAATDPDFIDEPGGDTLDYVATLPETANGPFTVEAALYYQSIPPRYLQDRFNQTGGPATVRLHHLGSRIDDSETDFQDWKLLVDQARQVVP
jgi:hypothetical protein